MSENTVEEKVRYAVVGAGWIAQAVFMPGVAATGNSVLGAIVTGDPEKARLLAKKYDVAHTYSYEQYDEMLAARVVDAVYIATPNFDHETYAVRALDAGVHVLLEKPAEISVEKTRRIEAAAKRALGRGTKLMVAYRLHFEPASLDLLRRVREREIGEPIFFASQFSQHVSPDNHRAKFGFDAGPVADMAPYPINAARNLFGDEPIEVSAFGARHPEAGLGEMDDTVSVMLRFPKNRLAQFVVSYGASAFGAYQLVGSRGVIEMSPAYTFQAGLTQRRTIADEKPKTEKFGAVDQFAGETKYFSECIQKNHIPEPDVEEGLLDVRVIEAIRCALETGQAQKLEPYTRMKKVDPVAQRETRGSRRPPALVNAHPPEEG